MTLKKTFSTLLLAAILCAPFTVSAQVTIGSDRAPSQWSLLDLCTREQQKALHNARMDSIQRNALVTPASPVNHRDSAQGLMLFNTDSDCLEFWSGTRWVSLCEGDTPDPCAGFGRLNATWCTDDAPTIADLTAKARVAGGRGTVVWYNAETAGSRFTNPNTPLVSGTYWAANCADATARVPVVVTLVDNCAPLSPTPDHARIAAFVNVMYDFQNQTLEAFTTTGGEATSWRWQMSVRVGGDAGTWGAWTDVNLPSANTARLRIPADFMYTADFGDTHDNIPRGTDNQLPNASAITVNGRSTNTVEIRFQCIMHNPHPDSPPGGITTTPLEILFIRTNTSGFGGSGNARYLTINRAAQGGTNPTGNTIRMALLNVGASNDIDDRGGGLGEFIQWGRTREGGHSATHWRRNIHVARNNSQYRTPFIGSNFHGWDGTSIPVRRNRFQMGTPDDDGQVTNSAFVNRFIYRTVTPAPADGNDWDWGGVNPPVDRNNLWGNLGGGPNSRSAANTPTSLDGTHGWDERAQRNNPCPIGWRVPSRFDWWDIYRGNGSNDPQTVTNGAWNNNSLNRNTWRFHPVQVNSSAFGGAVIINSGGEAVFLPAAGIRNIIDAEFDRGGQYGVYWTSTFHNVSSAWAMSFSSVYVSAGSANAGHQSFGFSVRCVQ